LLDIGLPVYCDEVFADLFGAIRASSAAELARQLEEVVSIATLLPQTTHLDIFDCFINCFHIQLLALILLYLHTFR
jgi:hypothetical protein